MNKYMYGLAGFIIGVCFEHYVLYECKEDPNPSEVGKYCHIVKHEDTDGFKFWSCEKNK